MRVGIGCIVVAVAMIDAASARADSARGQVSAAIGLGQYEGTYEPDFGALMLTAEGGALLSRRGGIGLRVAYFHGGETNEGGLVPEYEATRVPLLLLGRLQGRYAFAELGAGTTLSWIVDGDGETVRGASRSTLAMTVGLTTADPTIRYHPEVFAGAMQIGDGRLLWIAAGLSWW